MGGGMIYSNAGVEEIVVDGAVYKKTDQQVTLPHNQLIQMLMQMTKNVLVLLDTNRNDGVLPNRFVVYMTEAEREE
jgi:hypothetical protein